MSEQTTGVEDAKGYEVTKKNGTKEVLIPVGHHCLVMPDKVQTKTESGLFIPEAAQNSLKRVRNTGTLIALGPQCFTEFGDGKPWAKVGDRVVYAKYGGKQVFNYLEEDDDEFAMRLLNDEDILLVIQAVA